VNLLVNGVVAPAVVTYADLVGNVMTQSVLDFVPVSRTYSLYTFRWAIADDTAEVRPMAVAGQLDRYVRLFDTTTDTGSALPKFGVSLPMSK
jgi:hypothetical protein